MLPKVAHISDPMPATDLRGAPRRVVRFGLEVTRASGASRILILNLSRSGLLFQTSAALAIGDELAFEIPEAGLVEARIVRRDNDRFGARFTAPISQAAVSAVLLAAPARSESIEEKIAVDIRSTSEFNPVPDWLVLTILGVTTLAAAAFAYALLALRLAA